MVCCLAHLILVDGYIISAANYLAYQLTTAYFLYLTALWRILCNVKSSMSWSREEATLAPTLAP